MTTQTNKELLRRYKVHILNDRDVGALDQVAAADYVDHAAFPGQAPGLKGLKQRAVKPITLRGIDIYRIQDGKITEHWNVADILGFCQQTGALPNQAP
jgi:hypothetical protein